MSFDDGDNGENAREEYGAPRRRSRQRSEKPSQRAEGGTEAQAKDACLRLLTDRARSRSELETKLSGRGFEPEIITKVLDRLQEIGLIDDADFANQWVHSRHTYSGKGKRALAVELRLKGIDQDVASEALSQIDPEDERERAAELVRRKLKNKPVDDRDKVTRRLVSMLARKGYSAGMSYEVVKAEMAAVTDS
ncbi:recombination regulator RecX [Rhodococcus erythropolis]|jgi:regulatory protein|uniref:Regulatory protein RecX n=2 Tax=Rhodococcus erythropolis TaxID=1833 RepID=C0ZYM7_RHOE4|nr:MULTISPECIES: recombination regulator RecX [Rhodococcus]MCW0191757.1 recombination regulator RecX [Rhodococcus sp. (in: high G+C Gram-positive bacteria)]AKD97529.1 recombinase RecX [Rhodococcus erythropolis]MBF7734334.1 recombination regulator RecX [Rhodococcus erythropolis]MBH5147793.1 recombination regulator RecX [Rhodococcus erythropolis]MBY6385004.1 recombination regulator RecX [Rhodococcus erythropolis]